LLDGRAAKGGAQVAGYDEAEVKQTCGAPNEVVRQAGMAHDDVVRAFVHAVRTKAKKSP
jgi:hypothetical protein